MQYAVSVLFEGDHDTNEDPLRWRHLVVCAHSFLCILASLLATAVHAALSTRPSFLSLLSSQGRHYGTLQLSIVVGSGEGLERPNQVLYPCGKFDEPLT
jgi:hypothetical protein